MDIEKTMQFILDTQARLEATSSQHDERLAKLETSLTTVSDSLNTVTDLVGRLAQAEIRLVERMDRLAESQAQTDQRLDILVDVVDKLVRRNGSPR
jgi:ABC-type transporter Mla subunit MlaD